MRFGQWRNTWTISKKLPGSTLTDAACGLKETVCATAEGLFKLTDKALTKLGVSDYSGVIIGAYPDIGAYFGVTHPLYYGISGYPPRLSVLSQEPKAGVPNVVASTSTQNAAPAQGAASQMTMRACERALRDPTRLRTDMADKITAGVVAELCQGQEDITAPADCFHQFAAGKVPWSTKARNSPMPNYYSTWSVKSIVDACKSATVPGAISGCVTLWVYTGHTSIDAVKSCRQGGTSSATAQDCRPTDWNGMWNVQDGYNEQFLVIVPVVHGQDVAFKGTTIPSGLAFNGTIPAANACEVRGQWTSSAANGQFRFVMKPRLGNVAQANAFSGIWDPRRRGSGRAAR